MEAIKRLFSPEFRNRLDGIIQFNGLDSRTIQRVVDKLLVEVEAQLEQKGVQLHVDDAARGVACDCRANPILLSPKSVRRSDRPSASMQMLSGLMSRWTMPSLCKCSTATTI